MVQAEPKAPRLWNGGGSRLIIGQQMQPVFGGVAINGGIGHIYTKAFLDKYGNWQLTNEDP